MYLKKREQTMCLCDMLLITMSPEIQLKTASLPTYLICVDTTLVHPLNKLDFFCSLLIYRSNQKTFNWKWSGFVWKWVLNKTFLVAGDKNYSKQFSKFSNTWQVLFFLGFFYNKARICVYAIKFANITMPTNPSSHSWDDWRYGWYFNVNQSLYALSCLAVGRFL